MPDWDSPVETVRDNVYLTTTLHVCCGCAIWEYITQLRYEWDVIRGSGQYRWTIWVYSSCRLSMLSSLLLSIATAEGWLKDHCTALYATAMAISYVSIGLASLLIVLRVVAVWDKRPSIVIISYIIWLSGVVLNVRDVALLRASYNASLGACTPYNTSKFLPNSVGILGSDSLLLALMLIGILRKQVAPTFGVVRLLYRQGVVWLTVAFLVEVPVLVFCILDLNAPLALLLQPFELVTLGICAGRMYRGLMSYHFDAGSDGILLKDLPSVGHLYRPG